MSVPTTDRDSPPASVADERPALTPRRRRCPHIRAEFAIDNGRADPADLLGLSVWLADAIVGPASKDGGFTPLGALQRVVRTARSDQ